jgi:hypothetical protein
MTSAVAPRPNTSRRAAFLLGLRRWHARVGLAGAAFGVMWGCTGILLNHRDVMQIPRGSVEATQMVLTLDAAPASPDALAAELAKRLGFPATQAEAEVQPARAASFGGTALRAAEVWRVALEGHHRWVQGTYTPGDRTVQLQLRTAGFIETLKRLHKSEAGSPGWVLFADGVAGMILFMSLSGTLLWSRLAGPRLLALGLSAGAIALAVTLASRAW